MSAVAERNLLLGLLALQLNFVTREQLLESVTLWTRDKSQKLMDLLTRDGKLSGDTRQLLEALTDQYLQVHGGDLRQSLAALSSTGSVVREELEKLHDKDIESALLLVGVRADSRDTTTLAFVDSLLATSNRFRILRPHARGGLGEVYVATDEELQREVALKQIQEPNADDPGNRARFIREARITGGLEHPGIVPVYGLGHYDNGRPYYAMRFVRGDSLQEAIDQFHGKQHATRTAGQRSLELRKLLGRFVDVCEAMAYAHSRGVLHRDLKPGNIMLGRYGETLIVDWGLAKVLGGDAPESELSVEPKLTSPSSSDTRMGQAVGTPGFMSPEQATGRLNLLGPRSDVYGLGATLYCLLVGQRPFEGGPAEVLRKVERGEFSAPRRVNANVPRALEAICLKAMSLEPSQRYADPLAMSDDVEAWLADEPVSAWQEPLAIRVRRWIRRRQTGVATAAAATVVALVTSGIALSLVTTANRRLDRANDDLSKTNAKLKDSNERLTEAVAREEKAKAVAQEQSQLADENFHKARRVVDELFTDVSENPALLAGAPETQALRQRLLQRARDYYLEFSRQHAGDAALKSELADTQFRLGMIADEIGDKNQSRSSLQDALEIRERQARENPGVPEYSMELAKLLNNIGNGHRANGRYPEALAALTRALEIKERLSRENPTDRVYAAVLVNSYLGIGHLHVETDNPSAARSAYEQGMAVAERLVRDTPADAEFASLLMRCLGELGLYHSGNGNRSEALALYQRAQSIGETLRSKQPNVAEYENVLAETYNRLGVLYSDQKKPADALLVFEQAIAINQRLSETNPSVVSYQHDLAQNYLNVADPYYLAGRRDDALRAYQKSIDINERLSRSDPSVIEYRKDLSDALNNLGILHAQDRNYVDAIAAYRRAIEVMEQLRRQLPQRTELALGLAATLNNVGILYRREGRSADALQALQRAIEIKEKLVQDHPTSQSFQSSLAKSYSGLGTLQSSMGDQKLSLEFLQKALAIEERLAQAHPDAAEYRHELSKTLNNMAVTYRKDMQIQLAISSQQKSIDMVRRLADQNPTSSEYRSELAKGLLNLAAIQRDEKAFADSVQSYQSASETVGEFVKSASRHKVVDVFLRDAQWARGVREARELVEASPENAVVLYQQAAVHARVASSALNDASLQESARTQIVRDETAVVVSLLAQAQRAGYFQQAERVQSLRDDKVYAPLRSQGSFDEFLRGLK